MLGGALCGLLGSARAQNLGFQINRYEPTAPGEFSFWVDHPWYSSTRYFAGGVTLNYGHNPLVFGFVDQNGTFSQTQAVIAHQLIGHVDLAGSFLDRVLINASLPVVFLERGERSADGGVAPGDGVAVGDPRIGFLVRIWGQPYKDAFSISAGGHVWIPLRKFTDSLPAQDSDQEVRGMPKIVLGGLYKRFMWSATVGFLIRPEAVLGNLGDPTGRTAGSEMQLGLAALYADMDRRFAIGPELVLGTALSGNAFHLFYTSLEALLGIHYNVARQLQLGLAGGLGLLRQPGTPDGRVLFRIAYAPMRKPIPPDRDHDGVPDERDQCPDEPKGDHPDPDKLGCPQRDRDGDGVFDRDDQCPDQPKGEHPDPTRPGCPDGDKDGDGVYDHDDQCPEVPAGHFPDPARRGCPLPDRDKDTVPDPTDACPDQPGAPSPDPKKNGCPGLVEVKGGQIVIIKPVFFATNKDVILKKSFPVLESVVDALKVSVQIKKIRVEGHTDDRGKVDYNTELSDRRAKSVMKFLVEHGIAPERLTAQGYGPQKPIADNKTAAGRAKNRRVDFVIIDPPQAAGVETQAPSQVVVPESPDQSDKTKKSKKAEDSKAEKADKAEEADKAGKGGKKKRKGKAGDEAAPEAEQKGEKKGEKAADKAEQAAEKAEKAEKKAEKAEKKAEKAEDKAETAADKADQKADQKAEKKARKKGKKADDKAAAAPAAQK